MQVFKAYFRIVNKRRMLMLIYLIVFVALSAVISSMISSSAAPAAFAETKYNISFFNEDENAPLSDGLKQYLGQSTQIVEIGSRPQDVADALFYGHVASVVTVPRGFSESFMQGSADVHIEKIAASGMPSGIYIDFLINKYLNMAALYAKNMPDATQSQIVQYVAADLEKTAAVDYQQSSAPEQPDLLPFYFRFLAYSVLAMMMMGVSMVMMSFNEANVSNRMLCAPLRPVRMSLQLVLANAVLALVVWAVMCAFIFIANGDTAFDTGAVLLGINALVFTIVSLCIGFFAGKFIKNHGVQAAVTNVVSLGFSFISGVFVDQALLGKTVQSIASFTPSYWYIRAVEAIRVITVYNSETIRPVIESMLIQLGFAAVILVVTLAVSKQRRMTLASVK